MSSYYLCHLLLYITSSTTFLTLSSLFSSSVSLAAEKIVIRYGLFEESVKIANIRKYAETREVSSDLASFLNYLSPQQQQSLLEVLQIKIPLDIVAINKLVNSESGEKLMRFVNLAIARRDQAGIQALRSAIILGTKAPKGLGIISFLEAYPSESIVVNLPVALQMLNQAGWLNEDTDINEGCIYIIPK